MKPLKWKLVFGAFAVQLVFSASLYANPVISPFDKVMDWLLLSLIYAYIFLIETCSIKFILFGRDGPSWLSAFIIAVFVNVASAIVGILSHVYYDVGSYDFYPNFFAAFGISLGVESLVLVLLHLRSYPKRALMTGGVMNLISYMFLLLIRFPERI